MALWTLFYWWCLNRPYSRKPLGLWKRLNQLRKRTLVVRLWQHDEETCWTKSLWKFRLYLCRQSVLISSHEWRDTLHRRNLKCLFSERKRLFAYRNRFFHAKECSGQQGIRPFCCRKAVVCGKAPIWPTNNADIRVNEMVDPAATAKSIWEDCRQPPLQKESPPPSVLGGPEESGIPWAVPIVGQRWTRKWSTTTLCVFPVA